MGNLAKLYHELGKYAEAEALCRRTLAIREKQLGPKHPVAAWNLLNLAGICCGQGRYAEAEPLCRGSALSLRGMSPVGMPFEDGAFWLIVS